MVENEKPYFLSNTRNNLMRTPIARLVNCVALVSLCVAFASTSPLRAEPDTNKTKQRISRSLASLARVIQEIKWANVTIYKLQDELKQRVIEPQRVASARDSIEIEGIGATISYVGEPLPNFYQTVIRTATPARIRRDPAAFRERLATAYGLQVEDLDEQQSAEVLGIASKVLTELANIPKDYLLITTRDRNNPMLIALVGIEDNPLGGFSVKGQPQAGSDLYEYLRPLDATLYADLRSAVADNSQSLANQMFLLRNFDEIRIAPETQVRASYIDEERYPHVLLSISEGRPLRQQDSARLLNANLYEDPTLPTQYAAAPGSVEYPYEVTVGTDVIASFMAYRMTQDTLPVPEPAWGAELRNNFDEINYPSIWGGRLTLNAVLENIKIGAVLPQIRFGGNTVDSSGIGSSQQKIIGGYGLAISGDFAAPVLNNSGLFNFYGSYTFSEANTDKIRLFESVNPELGYLIRYAFQGYYSFGFYADAAAKHLFRMKIGGTVYGVEGFSRRIDTLAEVTGEGEEPPTLLQSEWTRSRGGISGRIEYMKGGQMVPWGAGVQYFDQSILANVWLQFAISRNLDLKLEGKYFTSFDGEERKISHPWENPNLIVPSLSVRYHFGPAPAMMP